MKLKQVCQNPHTQRGDHSVQQAPGRVPGAFDIRPGEHCRRLAVHRYAAPADEKGCKGEVSGRRRQPLHRADARAELEYACAQGARKVQLQPEPRSARAHQRGQQPGSIEHTGHDAECDHEAADRQHCAHGAAHGLRQRLRERHGGDLSARLRQRPAAARGEEHPDEHGRQHVHAVEQQPIARAVKHAHARRADEKRRTGIVAERERALRLLACERAAAPEPRHGVRAERIPARHAQQQRRRARAADAEELLRHGREPPAEDARQPELLQQRREHKKRQQRWHDHLCAEAQPRACALERRLRAQKQCAECRQRCRERDVIVPFVFHRHPSRERFSAFLCLSRPKLACGRINWLAARG